MDRRYWISDPIRVLEELSRTDAFYANLQKQNDFSLEQQCRILTSISHTGVDLLDISKSNVNNCVPLVAYLTLLSQPSERKKSGEYFWLVIWLFYNLFQLMGVFSHLSISFS